MNETGQNDKGEGAGRAQRRHGLDRVRGAGGARFRCGADAALHIDYGQRTEKREKRAFQEICDRMGIRTRLAFQTAFFSAIGGSALTDEQIAVPQSRPGDRGGDSGDVRSLSEIRISCPRR